MIRFVDPRFLTNPVVVCGLSFVAAFCICGLTVCAEEKVPVKGRFRAGAAAVDITPTHFPVIVNGGFNEVQANRAQDRLMSRAVVLDDGRMRLAIVVVDSLMIPRKLLDIAKQTAHESTGIPTERMLISATHTHSAPSAMGCLGSRADADYQQFLTGQIAKSIQQAMKNLAEAKVGWAVVQDYEHNNCRRWIYRPDRIGTDPFGDRNVRAHMHPGHQSPNHIAPAGPADPDLSLLSVQSAEGRPLVVLANYAMHYYGTSPVSADFCGRFGDRLAKLIGIEAVDPPFVGIMSQGTSGDSMWMDYSEPAPKRDLDQYTLEVARIAHDAYKSVKYHDRVSLAMAETTLKLRRRLPDAQRMGWAKSLLAEIGNRLPQSKPEIYAREQIYLHDEPEVEIKLQAIRIGELGITAIPNEVYGITGLKLKAQSPLQPTFNIELANGAQGYIPPPEQHALGGYTTWPARTAGLEVQAEPKIVATLLELLEKVADKPRRSPVAPANEYARNVLASRPVAYWRMNEMSGSRALDAIGEQHGVYENGVAFYLPGFRVDSTMSHRAAHFAGGRMQAAVKDLGESYSVELWFWNGLPHEARPVTGYFFSRGAAGSSKAAGDHLGIGGTHLESVNTGQLVFFNGNENDELLVGPSVIEQKSWNHVVLVRDGRSVRVYLNGHTTPEISGEASVSRPANVNDLFLGGRNDGFAPFEGKLSDVAVYDRVLSQDEIASHFKSSGVEIPETSTRIPSATGAANRPNDNSIQRDDPTPSDSRPAIATVGDLTHVNVSDDGTYFVHGQAGKRFVVWGVNYDHDHSGRLLDEYWIDEWQAVVEDFREIKMLGANCVRIHLQLGKFLDAPDNPNTAALAQLAKLVQLAENTGLYLDLTGLACYHKKNIPAWYDALTEQDRWKAQAVFWEAVAQTCRDSPAVFCYDLMNEPILPGKEPATEWLAGELDGKFFVQRLTLDLKDRTRDQVAEAWVNTMVDAIRKHDQRHMVTVGVIPWVFAFGAGKPLFHSPSVGKRLDFVAVHFYPKKGEVDKALKALKAYEIGKPLLIEEMFPLACSQDELAAFIHQSSDIADGWISFYWGATAKELRAAEQPTLGEAITASWLTKFHEMSGQMRQ